MFDFGFLIGVVIGLALGFGAAIGFSLAWWTVLNKAYPE